MTNESCLTPTAATDALITLARENAPAARMRSSADLCLNDAIELRAKDEVRLAAARAIDSLRYSVGILSATWNKACRLLDAALV